MTTRALSLAGYTATWIALVLLAALSFGLSYLSLGALELPVALLIGGAKAALVMLVFMELLEESFVARTVVAVVVGWLALLIGFMVLDVLTRASASVRVP